MKRSKLFYLAVIAVYFGLTFNMPVVCYANSPFVWQEGGIPIRQGNHIWWSGASAVLGEDMVFVTWSDTRTGFRYLMGQLYDENGAVWDDDLIIGRQINLARGNAERCPHWPTVQDDPVVTATTDGNVIVAWNESDYANVDDDYGILRVNKISPQGELLWGEGVVLEESKSLQLSLKIAANNTGGAYIVWTDFENDDIYGLHLNSDGEPYSEEWEGNRGLLLAGGEGWQFHKAIICDSDNNLILSYVGTYREREAVYIKKLTTDGETVWEREIDESQLTNDSRVAVAISTNDNIAIMFRSVETNNLVMRLLLINSEGENIWEEPEPVADVVGNLRTSHRYPKLKLSSDNGLITLWQNSTDGGGTDYSPGLYAQKFDTEGNRLWGDEGVQISGNRYMSRYYPATVCDGDGGVIIFWEEDRGNRYDIYMQRVNSEGELYPDDVPVTDIQGEAFAVAVNQIAGNLYVFWADEREGSVSMYYQIYDDAIQPLFQKNGKRVLAGISEGVYSHNVIKNGGYAYIVWVDERYRQHGRRIMVQKLDSDGNIHFAENGIPVTVETGSHQMVVWFRQPLSVTPHHSGGIALTWVEKRSNWELVYAQAISPEGEMLWGDKGVRVSATDDIYYQDRSYISRRGEEYIIVYDETDPGDDWSYIRDIRAQKIVDGVRVWGDEGIHITRQFGEHQADHSCVAFIEGEYVVWRRFVEGGSDAEASYHIKRIDEDGNVYPGWDEYGTVIVDVPGHIQTRPVTVMTDEGVVVLWEDRRAETHQQLNRSIYGQLISPEGEIMWEENGIAIVDYDYEQSLISAQYDDGYVYLTWRDSREGPVRQDIAFQKIDLQGNTLWGEPSPFIIKSDYEGDFPQLLKSGETVLVLWENNPDSRRYTPGISAQLASARTGEKFWNEEGLNLTPFGGMNIRPQLISFGDNKTLAIWSDGRSGDRYNIQNIYAQKIDMFTELNIEDENILPQQKMKLHANYPNPFNPDTNIAFGLSQDQQVSLMIYNVRGQLVRTLLDNEHLERGRHNLIWDGQDESGRISGSGVYFYRLTGENESFTRKMVMIK